MPTGRTVRLSPDDLSAFVDGDLGWWRRRRIRRHLQACEPCHRYVEQLAAMTTALRGSPAPELTQHLRVDLQDAYAGWQRTQAP